MVLLPVDATATIRAFLLTLLMMRVSGYVSEDQVARQDMLCDKQEIKEPVHGRYSHESHSDHENCMIELRRLIWAYVSAKAMNAHVTDSEWLKANAYKYDASSKCYTLIVRGGPNNSNRYVTYNPSHYEYSIRPPSGDDEINQRFMALKERQKSKKLDSQ